MSFSKRAKNASICYTKPLDSLKNWNDHFFWVDASVFPLDVPWHNDKTLRKDPHPTPAKFNVDVCNYLADNPAPDGFVYFYHYADPTKVRIGEREVAEGEVPLLQLTRDRVVPLAGVNDQEDVNVHGVGDDDVNEGDGDAAEANQTEQGEHVIDVGGIDVVADDEVQAIVADKPQRVRKKRKAADGASGSGLPLKKLREFHSTSGIGANTGGKSIVALQRILEGSTLPVEVGVAAITTVHFVTSSVTPNSISGTGLWIRHPAERFVISLDSSHDLNANAIDDEVTSVIRSSMPPPSILTAAVATTITAGVTSAPVHGSDVAGPSQPVGTELSAGSFYVSQDMDPETLWQVYIPKWNVINDFVLDDLNIFLGMIDHLAPPRFFSQLRGMDYEQLLAKFSVGTARQERDVEIASLKAQLSLKEAEAAEAIRLSGQVAMVEAVEAARASELNDLKERNAALERQVVALESAVVSKDVELASSNAQVAKVTQDLSSLQLSYDELSIKAASLEFKKDKLVDQTTCSGLRDEVMGYKLFKEQVEAMQDEQVKALGDRVAAIDSDLMEMALHMDEEFYPRYLTTIVGRRWIFSCGLKLVIMKCLQSPEYLATLGGVIGRAIDTGMQDGLAAGIDHGKARRGLVNVVAYNSFAEADYVVAINALRAMDFTLLAQLESRKDASMADIMDLLCLEGPAAETPEASQLQPSPEQLMIIRGDDAACRLSLKDAMVPLIEPLSVKSLTGEASTSGVPAIAMTTGLSTTFIQADIIY
ncbi:hypothetical protein Tco_0763626 [Tanacetum coccineum]